MKSINYIKFSALSLVLVYSVGCTKLDQDLNSTLTNEQAANAFDASLFLQTAYNDLGTPFSNLGNVFALEEVSTDECVVPTRAADWDDNGKWRALHQHTWTSDNVNIFLDQFNALNKINFDATNVLTFNPTVEQIAEARFIRAISLYQLLDLFGQFPFRNPGENLLNAPKVYSGDSAVQFIISELNAVIPDLSAGNPVNKATPDAAKVLLMRMYLNKGAFLNRQAPTFDAADLQQVITLGTQIMNSGSYTYNKNYFDNFSPNNGDTTNTETIFANSNTAGITANNTDIDNRWWSTLHYNQYDKLAPQAGWNGFSTVADFYNTFGTTTTPTKTPADTLLDTRIGGRYYQGVTNVSGVRTGLLIGQQYDQNGVKYQDRKGNPLVFDPNLSSDLKENGPTLEDKGIRVIKYLPDYSTGTISYSTPGNWFIFYRYADVVLMVAEAKMRSGDNAGALALVNELRTARKAKTLSSIVLANESNVYDPNTLLAERGRELYWENVRRTDLIRFGVFLKPWAYKTTDDPHFLVYPVPPAALAANPNLTQNDGY